MSKLSKPQRFRLKKSINYENKFKVINLIIENISTEKCSHVAMLFINIYNMY